MKCDDFLPWLASENSVRRALARRHARRCASCRAAASLLDDVKHQLAVDEPLPERLEEAFLSAADAKETASVSWPTMPARSGHRRELWLAALAAAVLLALAPWLFGPRRQGEVARAPDPPRELRRVSEIVIVAIDSSAEFVRLENDLAALQVRLKEVEDNAHRLAAAQELGRVLADHDRVLVAAVF
jgi:hypothetical protein